MIKQTTLAMRKQIHYDGATKSDELICLLAQGTDCPKDFDDVHLMV